MEGSLTLSKDFRRSVKARHFLSPFVCIYICPLQLKEYNSSTKNDTDFTLRLTSWILELGKLSNILTVQGISEIEKKKIQNLTYSGFKVLSFQLNKIKTFFLLYLIILMIRFMGKNIFYFHCTITCKKVILYVFYPYFLDTGGQCFCSGSFFLFSFLRMCYLLTCVSWYIGSLHTFFYIYLSNLSKYK